MLLPVAIVYTDCQSSGSSNSLDNLYLIRLHSDMQNNAAPSLEEQRAAQEQAEDTVQYEEGAAEQERVTQKMRDKEQRRVCNSYH